MGILYTITSYLYPHNPTPINEHAIRTKSQRLIFKIKNIQYKLQQETFKQEQQLANLLKESTLSRSLLGQVLRMNVIIEKSERIFVYDQIIYSLNKIIAEAALLEHNPSYISNECVVAISSLIFVYQPLSLKELINLNEFIPEPHPSIDVKKISALLRKYLNKKEVSDYERNTYIVEMIKRNNLSLQSINAIGHNFVQKPAQAIYESPSSHAFAVTLEQFQIVEQ